MEFRYSTRLFVRGTKGYSISLSWREFSFGRAMFHIAALSEWLLAVWMSTVANHGLLLVLDVQQS
jgi:hypothetical protein